MRISNIAALALGTAAVLVGRAASAEISIDDTSVVVSFSGFTGLGFTSAPGAGQLSSNDWAITGFSDGDLSFGGNQTSNDYTRGDPDVAVTDGGIYAFGSDANRFLGFQASTADFTPGSMTARFKNDLTRPLLSLELSHKVMVRNDTDNASTLNFAWSKDGVNFTSVAALNYTSPTTAVASAPFTSVTRTTTITTNIPEDGLLYLRWSSDDGPGATGSGRDELGVDDITIEVLAGCGDGIAQGSEACDDGNSSNSDNCLNDCTQAICGDGYVRSSGEECDPDAEDTECCSNACQFTSGNACTGGLCDDGTCVASGSGGRGGGGRSGGGRGGSGGDSGEAGDNGESGEGGETTTGGSGGRTGSPGGRGGANAGSSGGGAPAAGASAGGVPSTGGAPASGAGGNAGTAGTTATGGAPAGGGQVGGAGKAGSSTGGKGGTSSKPPADSKDDSGCGCSVPSNSERGGLALVLGAALSAFAAFRRRSRV